MMRHVAAVLSVFLPRVSGKRIAFTSVTPLMGLLVVMVFLSGVLAEHEARLQQFSLAFAENFRQGAAMSGDSGINVGYAMTTGAGVVLSFLFGFAYLLLAPFPWEMDHASIRMLATLPEVIFWWWLFFVAVLPGLLYSLRERLNEIIPMLMFGAALSMLYSLLFGNVGLAFRQRGQLLPWMLILAMVGLEQRLLRRRQARRVVLARAA